MAENKSKTKPKRLSKGQRKHVRRLKQEARKDAIPTTSQPSGAPRA